MERPWTYYLLLVVAWLAALWGLWQIGEAWVTWPTIDSAVAREGARGKLWLAGALIGGGLMLGGLATLIRVVQDGFAQLASRPVETEAVAAAQAPAVEAAIVAPRAPAPDAKPQPKAQLKPEPKPEPTPEPKREPKLIAEPRLEPADRLSGEFGPGPREPRFDRLRPSEGTQPARREPKFTPDA